MKRNTQEVVNMSGYKKPYKHRPVKRCYESHPTIEIGGGEILGASCIYPQKGYDIYIGFDRGMSFLGGSYPWEDDKDAPVEFLFKITDMSVPSNLKQYKKMIKWITGELKVGKKIHMGCIGGHGRTGMVLSTLLNQIDGEADSTTWVRDNYCKKAVESKEQVDFLHKHFGIKKTSATKEYLHKGHSVSKSPKGKQGETSETILCIDSPFTIW